MYVQVLKLTSLFFSGNSNEELHIVTKMIHLNILLLTEKLDSDVFGVSNCFHKIFLAHGFLQDI